MYCSSPDPSARRIQITGRRGWATWSIKMHDSPSPLLVMRQTRAEAQAAEWSHLGLVVLEPVGLVHHQARPLDGAQHGLVDGDQLVGRQQHVELHRGVFLSEHMKEDQGGVSGSLVGGWMTSIKQFECHRPPRRISPASEGPVPSVKCLWEITWGFCTLFPSSFDWI